MKSKKLFLGGLLLSATSLPLVAVACNNETDTKQKQAQLDLGTALTSANTLVEELTTSSIAVPTTLQTAIQESTTLLADQKATVDALVASKAKIDEEIAKVQALNAYKNKTAVQALKEKLTSLKTLTSELENYTFLSELKTETENLTTTTESKLSNDEELTTEKLSADSTALDSQKTKVEADAKYQNREKYQPLVDSIQNSESYSETLTSLQTLTSDSDLGTKKEALAAAIESAKTNKDGDATKWESSTNELKAKLTETKTAVNAKQFDISSKITKTLDQALSDKVRAAATANSSKEENAENPYYIIYRYRDKQLVLINNKSYNSATEKDILYEVASDFPTQLLENEKQLINATDTTYVNDRQQTRLNSLISFSIENDKLVLTFKTAIYSNSGDHAIDEYSFIVKLALTAATPVASETEEPSTQPANETQNPPAEGTGASTSENGSTSSTNTTTTTTEPAESTEAPMESTPAEPSAETQS
ncbi:variable surface lipoprotein [Mycoplasmopsis columbina]|uniref:variable surface lipoprotein n=1 Tax=Mycoplasmopsis columbina TaxID=114881 RepID=UPI0004A6D8E1|nr:variable surface lipoprotein [Mycoplasmopsis columbina]VEU76665.1 Uncharacterised protein [Mycoplasmopsis columbina]